VTWALVRDDPDGVGCALRIIGALAFESQMNGAAGVGTWADQALPHIEIASAQVRYAVAAAAAYASGRRELSRPAARTKRCDGVPPGAPAPSVAHLGCGKYVDARDARGLAITLGASRLLDRDFPGSAPRRAPAIAAMIATQTGVRSPAPSQSPPKHATPPTTPPTLCACGGP
jgi:hypothetical protein